MPFVLIFLILLKLVPIDAAVIFNAVAPVAFHQSSRVWRGSERGEFILETHRLFPFWVSAPSAFLFCLRHESPDTVQVRPTWQEGERYRERQSLFPVLVNHISVQFPSVLFGNGGMTGVIYHTD